MKISRRTFCASIASAPFLPIACAGNGPRTTDPSLGVNLAAVSYYSSELVFVNVFKQSQPWTSQVRGKGRDQGPALELDQYGWVKKLVGDGHYAESIIFADLKGHYPRGNYVCLYDGSGDLEFAEAADIMEARPGRLVVKVLPANGPIAVRLTRTDPRNPVRNIRLIAPGFEKTYINEPFHPDFIKRWEGFGALRFMDWGRTNNSRIVKWADRTTTKDATQGTDLGVAVEYQIALANTLKIDPWLCVPHKADDDYVRDLARVIREQLDSERKVYVEYSNECWHPGFEGGRYCVEKGVQLGLSKQEYEAGLRYYAQRSVEIFRLFDEGGADKSRFIRVLGAQPESEWSIKTILDWKDAATSADALSVAHYFGNDFGKPAKANQTESMSVDELLAACRKEIADNNKRLQSLVKLAQDRKLRVLGYEGGQHLVGADGKQDDEKLTRLFQSANRSPLMKEAYLETFRGWREAGGGLLCIYNSVSRYSKWGSWGHLEFSDQDESTSPKMQAVRAFLATG